MNSAPLCGQRLTKRWPHKEHGSVGLIVAVALIALASWACGDDSEPSARETQGGSATSTATENSQPDPRQTFSPELLETAVAAFREVPVISEELATSWTEEGEPGPTLAELCPPVGLPSNPFAQGTSRLLTRNGEQARSSAVFFVEQSLTIPYSQQVFSAASVCAEQLVQSWFDETVEFGPRAPEEGISEQATLVESSGAIPAAVLFFKVEEAVGAVAVFGGDSAASARDLAALLSPVIDEILSGGGTGQ